jgi:hypothetical protein
MLDVPVVETPTPLTGNFASWPVGGDRLAVRRRAVGQATDGRYKGDITAGSLKVPESRVIAGLLLRGVGANAWKDAIVKQNVLKARTPATANLLHSDSIVRNLVNEIDEDDWQEVEIIGWLYEAYVSERYEAVIGSVVASEGTLARMRTEYVIPLQGRIAARIEQLENEKNTAKSASRRNQIQKEIDKLVKQQAELRGFDERLRHMADQRIKLDLDDGVKVNYAKFGDLLAEVKAVTGGKEEE